MRNTFPLSLGIVVIGLFFFAANGLAFPYSKVLAPLTSGGMAEPGLVENVHQPGGMNLGQHGSIPGRCHTECLMGHRHKFSSDGKRCNPKQIPCSNLKVQRGGPAVAAPPARRK
jgi:hypothetical protein